MVGGFGAAFAAAACCGLPLLLSSLGIGSGWLFGIAVRAAPHRAALLIVAVVLLALGAWALWRQIRRVCEPGAWCARGSVRMLTAVGLIVGVVLAVLGYRYG
jgi:mercuric ion transport protein